MNDLKSIIFRNELGNEKQFLISDFNMAEYKQGQGILKVKIQNKKMSLIKINLFNSQFQNIQLIYAITNPDVHYLYFKKK